MTLKTGIHDISLADYLADPCPKPSLSSHVAHALLEQSPLHAWNQHPKLNPHYKSEDSTRFDLGSAAHNRLLEGGNRLTVIEAQDYRKKEAQEARDKVRAEGKIPVLASQKQTIDDMVGAAAEAICKSELADIFKPKGGTSEQTIIWQEGGIWCRTRPDRLSDDRRILCDYKTTENAEPSAWVRGPMLANGCDLQAAMGLRGIQQVGDGSRAGGTCAFVFIVQEVSPPYAVSFIGFGEQFKFYADVRVHKAISLWGSCLKSNRWPGYPSRVAWMSPPPYKTKEWDEQMEAMDKESA